jgi:diguanylate cyclase (GGDEF)-like protein
VLLPATTKDGAFIVAERLRFEVELQSKKWEIPVTVSIGIAAYPSDGASAEELLTAIEKALKLSKDKGKNQITIS